MLLYYGSARTEGDRLLCCVAWNGEQITYSSSQGGYGDGLCWFGIPNLKRDKNERSVRKYWHGLTFEVVCGDGDRCNQKYNHDSYPMSRDIPVAMRLVDSQV